MPLPKTGSSNRSEIFTFLLTKMALLCRDKEPRCSVGTAGQNQMARVLLRTGNGASRRGGTQASKYDAHHTVLSKTYGAFADLRRELADSKAAVCEREELLRNFAICVDSQRAWLLLEDYFE